MRDVSWGTTTSELTSTRVKWRCYHILWKALLLSVVWGAQALHRSLLRKAVSVHSPTSTHFKLSHIPQAFWILTSIVSRFSGWFEMRNIISGALVESLHHVLFHGRYSKTNHSLFSLQLTVLYFPKQTGPIFKTTFKI